MRLEKVVEWEFKKGRKVLWNYKKRNCDGGTKNGRKNEKLNLIEEVEWASIKADIESKMTKK